MTTAVTFSRCDAKKEVLKPMTKVMIKRVDVKALTGMSSRSKRGRLEHTVSGSMAVIMLLTCFGTVVLKINSSISMTYVRATALRTSSLGSVVITSHFAPTTAERAQ